MAEVLGLARRADAHARGESDRLTTDALGRHADLLWRKPAVGPSMARHETTKASIAEPDAAWSSFAGVSQASAWASPPGRRRASRRA